MLRYAISGNRLGSGLRLAPDRIVSGAGRASTLDLPEGFEALLAQVRCLAAEGIDFFQLREKSLEAEELAALASAILATLRQGPGPTRLLINTHAGVASATSAHGVHLPASPGGRTPARIRALYASLDLPVPIVSQACHRLDEVRHARDLESDLILFSPVFGKPLHDGESAGGDRDPLKAETVPGAGLDALHEACVAARPVPVLALGGVTLENAASCMAAGASGIAGIRLFERHTLCNRA